jgi:transposase
MTKGRGKRKQHPAKNLWDRLDRFHDSVLAFAENRQVPFDNNQAERDVRMAKVKQKISGTFRSTKDCQVFCRIRGFISTMRKQGISILQAIQETVKGNVDLLPIK